MALALVDLVNRMNQPSLEERDRAEAMRSALTGVGSDERGRTTPFDDGRFTLPEAAGEGMKITQAAARVAHEYANEGFDKIREGYVATTDRFVDRFSETAKFALHPSTTLRENIDAKDIKDFAESTKSDIKNIPNAMRGFVDKVRGIPDEVRDIPDAVKSGVKDIAEAGNSDGKTLTEVAGSSLDQFGKETLDVYLNRNYREEGNLSDISGKIAREASGAEVETQGPSVADRVGEIQSKQAEQAQAALGDEGMER